MRQKAWFSRRLFLVAILAVPPSAVALVACDTPIHLPGLANELPNLIGDPVGIVATTTSSGSAGGTSGTGGTGGAGGSTITTDAGAAQSLCDTAEALSNGVTACKSCEGTMCVGAFTACEEAVASECSTGIQCVASCASGDGSCISGCLSKSPAYLTFIQCVYSECAASCGWSPPLSCSVDAGTD